MSRMPVGKLCTIAVVLLFSLYVSAPSLKMPGLFGVFMGPEQFGKYKADTIGLGLDLKGGMDLIYRVETKKEGREREREVGLAVEIIRNRVDLFGVTNAVVQVQGDNHIRAQIPVTNEKMQKKIKSAIDLTDLLKLHHVQGVSSNVMAMVKGPDQILMQESISEAKKLAGDQPNWFLLKKEPELKGDSLSRVEIGFDGLTGSPRINMQFTNKGAKVFGEVTKKFVGERLAVVLGNKVYIAPVIEEEIPSGRAEIKGSFDIEEARTITKIMSAGALPAELTKLGEATVGPTLGEQSIKQGFSAAAWGFVIVLVYMVLYYKLAGFFAVVALLMNLLLLIAGLKGFDAALTLPGIAGVILTIGMAVDANVIIFERIKEERRLGKSLRGSIAGGFDKALSAVLDSNLTTIITAVVLYLFGSGPVKGFAVTLILGIASSLFTALFVVRTFLEAKYFGKSAGTLSI